MKRQTERNMTQIRNFSHTKMCWALRFLCKCFTLSTRVLLCVLFFFVLFHRSSLCGWSVTPTMSYFITQFVQCVFFYFGAAETKKEVTTNERKIESVRQKRKKLNGSKCNMRYRTNKVLFLWRSKWNESESSGNDDDDDSDDERRRVATNEKRNKMLTLVLVMKWNIMFGKWRKSFRVLIFEYVLKTAATKKWSNFDVHHI